MPRLRHRSVFIAFACVLSLQCVSCVFARMTYFNVPSLNAPSYFDERCVRASPHPLPFVRRPDPASFAVRESRNKTYRTFEDLVAENHTRALLVLHRDVIVYERYFGDVTAETRLPCFSASKPFVAVLIGCALEDGLIASIQRHLVDFVPVLAARPGYADITLEHLLRMTSGIDFVEESVAAATLYYTTDLRSETY